jgi:hypothetical protein
MHCDPLYLAKFANAPHVQLITERLEAFHRGEIKRLFISMPPRHGKSYCVSRLFPPWILGRNPRASMILASYGADLAEDFSRYQINLMQSSEYKELFTTELSDQARAAKRYSTTEGGTVIACGVGGPIYGRGADFGIIDDPIKDWEEARSKTRLEHLWEWYRGFITRLHKGGAVAICMHRWNENDLAARIMERDRDHGRWEILELPALAAATPGKGDPLGRDDGVALWPTEYDEKALAELRDEVGPRVWAAQYQQRPKNTENLLFPEPTYDEPPAAISNIIAYLDPAYSEGETSDFCALTIGAKAGELVFILAGYLWRSTIDKSYDRIEALCKQHNVSALYVEINKDEGAVAYELRRRNLWVNEKRTVKNKFLRITDAVLKNWSSLRFSVGITETYMGQVLDYYELADHDDAPDSLAGLCEILFPTKPIGVISRRQRGEN